MKNEKIITIPDLVGHFDGFSSSPKYFTLFVILKNNLGTSIARTSNSMNNQDNLGICTKDFQMKQNQKQTNTIIFLSLSQFNSSKMLKMQHSLFFIATFITDFLLFTANALWNELFHTRV